MSDIKRNLISAWQFNNFFQLKILSRHAYAIFFEHDNYVRNLLKRRFYSSIERNRRFISVSINFIRCPVYHSVAPKIYFMAQKRRVYKIFVGSNWLGRILGIFNTSKKQYLNVSVSMCSTRKFLNSEKEEKSIELFESETFPFFK